MAIDSRDKRASILSLAVPVRALAPNPDGSLAAVSDRRFLAYCYAGDLQALPTEAVTQTFSICRSETNTFRVSRTVSKTYER